MPALLPVIGAVVAASLPTIAAKIAGAIAVGYLSQKIAESEQRSALRKLRARGERFNIRSAVEPLPVIYGRVNRLPGLIVFQKGHGTIPGDYWAQEAVFNNDTRLLTTVVAWSEGEIWAYGTQWINDIDSDDSRFTQLTYIRNFTGTDAQTADAELVAQSAAENNAETIGGMWTAAHRLRGVAYTIFTCSYSPGSYGADGIPTFTADVLGKVCYDPRNDQTYWTRTPALHILDYLLNDRYGAAIPAAEIDFASFASAASYCEEKDLTLENRTQRYVCDAIIDPSDNWFDAVSDLLGTCRGWLVYSGGTYKLILDRPTPVTFDLNEDNLTGAWSIQMDSLGERVNRITAEFIDDAEQSKPNSVTVDDAAYRIADGNELLKRTISLPGVTSDGQARDLATMELRASRYSLIVEVNALLEAMRCEVGDVVSLTHSVPGWTAKPFRVERIALQSTDEVRLTLREYSDTVYSDQTENADVPPGTTLADPAYVYPPVLFNITVVRTFVTGGSWLHGFDLSWTVNTAFTAYLGGFHIEWRSSPAAQWTHATVARTDAVTYQIRGLDALTEYEVRIRAYNSIGAVSIWIIDSATTLANGVAEEALAAYNDVIRDPAVSDPSYWDLRAGTTWLPTGGPDGTPCIQVDPLPSGAGFFSRRIDLATTGVPFSDNGSTVKVVLIAKRLSSATTKISIVIAMSNAALTAGGSAGSYTLDLSSWPVGQWATTDVITIGPLTRGLGLIGNTDLFYLLGQITATTALGTGSFCIAGFYVDKV